jgi:hypothetical protein
MSIDLKSSILQNWLIEALDVLRDNRFFID